MEPCKELIAFRMSNPYTMSESNPAKLHNLIDGKWCSTKNYNLLPDPLNGEKFIHVPKTSEEELEEFIISMKKVPKTGLHNPFKNPQRYAQYGAICRRAAELLHMPDICNHFAKLIQRIMPKSEPQALGEVKIVRTFLENFSGDNLRYLASSYQVPGDGTGQRTTGYRWPYGPVIVISPFNFPLEIPALQLMGALFMGNKPLIKPHSKTTVVMEEFIRMLIYSGMPATDVDLIHIQGPVFEKIYAKAGIRMTQFTGSSEIAEKLSLSTGGRLKIEDSGLDWKVLGPDVSNVDYVVWQCDQDSYSLSGQKCSAEKLLFVHENWAKPELKLYEKMKERAAMRNLNDLTLSPVLSLKNKEFFEYVEKLLKLEGAKVLFGNEEIKGHKIPPDYGSFVATAIFVPLNHFLTNEGFELLSKEVFGPFKVITEYKDSELDQVLQVLERIPLHLTAAVVSNNPFFKHKVLGNTVNGTTYAGQRARTTGAPQNHWFGPAGDPR